jgi:hypothetical protein
VWKCAVWRRGNMSKFHKADVRHRDLGPHISVSRSSTVLRYRITTTHTQDVSGSPTKHMEHWRILPHVADWQLSEWHKHIYQDGGQSLGVPRLPRTQQLKRSEVRGTVRGCKKHRSAYWRHATFIDIISVAWELAGKEPITYVMLFNISHVPDAKGPPKKTPSLTNATRTVQDSVCRQ